MTRAMQSTLSKADITEEEASMAMVQAEALLNSKPLTVLSSDEEDLRPLIPNHFMVGHVNASTAMEVVPEGKVHPHNRLRFVQFAMYGDVGSRKSFHGSIL